MTITDYLTQGGIPDGWSVENLRWLAQAHRRLSRDQNQGSATAVRADWHQRWAALIEDVLGTGSHGGH